MLSKFLEYEANKKDKYYRVIQTNKPYNDDRNFPINEVVESDKPVNFNAEDRTMVGGFCISTYNYIFRWLVRGDTLCQVVIPQEYKIYKTISKDGIYVADHIILKNPIKVDDNLALELYKKSRLTENSYFRAMTACAIKGYGNTALKVCNDKVNETNVEIAIKEVEGFCKRRKEEKFFEKEEDLEILNLLKQKLEKLNTINAELNLDEKESDLFDDEIDSKQKDTNKDKEYQR